MHNQHQHQYDNSVYPALFHRCSSDKYDLMQSETKIVPMWNEHIAREKKLIFYDRITIRHNNHTIDTLGDFLNGFYKSFASSITPAYDQNELDLVHRLITNVLHDIVDRFKGPKKSHQVAGVCFMITKIVEAATSQTTSLMGASYGTEFDDKILRMTSNGCERYRPPRPDCIFLYGMPARYISPLMFQMYLVSAFMVSFEIIYDRYEPQKAFQNVQHFHNYFTNTGSACVTELYSIVDANTKKISSTIATSKLYEVVSDYIIPLSPKYARGERDGAYYNDQLNHEVSNLSRWIATDIIIGSMDSMGTSPLNVMSPGHVLYFEGDQMFNNKLYKFDMSEVDILYRAVWRYIAGESLRDLETRTDNIPLIDVLLVVKLATEYMYRVHITSPSMLTRDNWRCVWLTCSVLSYKYLIDNPVKFGLIYAHKFGSLMPRINLSRSDDSESRVSATDRVRWQRIEFFILSLLHFDLRPRHLSLIHEVEKRESIHRNSKTVNMPCE